jgi:RecA-family ATPase
VNDEGAPFITKKYAPADGEMPPFPSEDDYGVETTPQDDEDDTDREERDLSQRIVEAPAMAYDPEPQRQWIVEAVIPDETLTLLSGEGGIGKTTLALQLAVAMRTEGDWLGMKVKQEPVLFVTSEDDRKDVNLNLRAILKEDGKSLAHCPDLHILPLADRDACLAAASTKLGAIAATPLWHALVRVVERLKPRLVIFDALADLFGGEENSRRHARGFIVLLKQLAIRQKLAVVLIAHPSLTGMATGSGLSGSTDWHNGPRARLYFQRPKDKDDKTSDVDLRHLTVMKIQYAREGTVFRLRRKAGFFVYEGRDGGSTFDRAASAAKAETVFLALLQAFEDQGRNVSPNPGPTFAPTVFESEDGADGVTKAALKRVMSKLLKDNRVHVETTGPPSKQRSKLTPGPDPAKT